MLDIHNYRSKMTKIIVDIDADLNKRFRDAILKDKGWNKGVIKEALREAIELWIESKSGETKPEKIAEPMAQ